MENIFVEFLPPWVETGIQPAFYDKESGSVLQQTARMYARVNMLIRMFNKLSKQTKEEIEEFESSVNETVEHYIEEFTTLYNYVHDYFDNLDVQEEINHKLDEMVDDGTLQTILLNYTTTPKIYDTTRAMIADKDNLVEGEKVLTLGYYTINDGGGAEFLITTTSSSDYEITLDTNLYALMITNNINVDQLGANGGNNALSVYFDTLEDAQMVYPNATDLTELIGGVAIQCAINFYHDHKISFGRNTYYTNTTLTSSTYNRIYLSGDAKWKSVIQRTDTSESTTSILELTSSSSRCVIENLDFVGPYEVTDTNEATLNAYKIRGVYCNRSSYNTIQNCVFRLCGSGVNNEKSWDNSIVDCYFTRCKYGLATFDIDNNNLRIEHCFAEYNNYGLYLSAGRSQLIINCDFERNNVRGIQRFNEGDIQIISCYFEDDIRIYESASHVDNALICGCSFYQSSGHDEPEFYSPILLNGSSSSRFTVMNCNFIDKYGEELADQHPAIALTGNVKPVFISNKMVHMVEYIGRNAISIGNGKIEMYQTASFASTFINCSAGGEKTLTLTEANQIRLNLQASGTYTIKMPTIATEDYQNHEFYFMIPPNVNNNQAGTITFTYDDVSTCYVAGKTSVTISDKNKMLKATYMGKITDGRATWVITESV